MDNIVELTALFRLPLLCCAVTLGVGGGVLGLASKRTLKRINAAFASSADVEQEGDFLDRVVETDRFLLRHSRSLGMSALATSTVLIYQIF